MRRVIVTGASGFLGSGLVCKLLEEQAEVFAVVRSPKKMEAGLLENGRLHLIELDLDGIYELPEKITEKGSAAFYHFAWAGTSGEERENYELQIGNVKAACNAVEAAGKLGCKKFINAGSLMEYEAMKYMQTPGKSPAGNYLYRSAKLAAHYMAKSEAGRIGLPFINLIISNVYGRGEKSGRFIDKTLRSLLSGVEVSFTSGVQLYDFIHIKDAAKAFYLVGKYGKPYEEYYIGSGKVQHLRQYIEEMYECLPIDAHPEFGQVPYDGAGLSYREFDREKLKNDARFCCEVSFQEGILDAYRWLKEESNGFQLGI